MSPSNLKTSLYLTRDNPCVNLFQDLHNCSPPKKTNKQTKQTNETKQKTETTGHDDYQPIKIQCDPTLHCSATSPGESTPGSCPWSSAQFLINHHPAPLHNKLSLLSVPDTTEHMKLGKHRSSQVPPKVAFFPLY